VSTASSSSQRLRDAVDAVVAAGKAAGLDDGKVRDEAATIAAGVCRDVPDAADAWAATFGQGAGRFAGAARVGAEWGTQPAPLLAGLLAADRTDAARAYGAALADVAIEACALDPDPSLSCIYAAGLLARAQLGAAGVPPPPVATATTPVAVASAPVPVSAKAAEAQTAPAAPAPTLAELQAQLDSLIGLTAVKDQVHRQVALLRVNELRKAKGLKTPGVTRHLVFVGNPGTGKTTVARLVAGIYRALGLLEKGQLIETDRSGLVAGYVGQTALKTADVIKTALGGVLFIDEAYALASDDFGGEAVDILVKAMEDHRADLVVIVAGYTEEMKAFIDSNPGLESRFGTTITFPDYTEDELVKIFEQCCREADFTPTTGCIARLRDLLRAEPRDKGFGNGRLVRNLFEGAVARQAWRLREKDAPSVDDLRRLRADDLPDAARSGG
jgi:Holliday junction resolvasome RuvABC ATP-dependent DNA helicase subunit